MRIRALFLVFYGITGSLGLFGIVDAHGNIMRLATSSSTESTGLVDILVPAFEADSGYSVRLFVVDSGRAMRLARLGDVDAILVHAPVAERKFIQDGWGVDRRPVMKNDFVLVGPASDPAQVRGLTDIAQVLRRISAHRSVFVSRGDDSGTHKKELRMWSEAGVEPAGGWYYEAGMGTGLTLEVAAARQAYTLVDRGTWLTARGQLSLVLLVEDGPVLENPYGIIAVNPERHPGVNYKAARAFIDWIVSPRGRRLIESLRVDGQQLFFTESAAQE